MSQPSKSVSSANKNQVYDALAEIKLLTQEHPDAMALINRYLRQTIARINRDIINPDVAEDIMSVVADYKKKMPEDRDGIETAVKTMEREYPGTMYEILKKTKPSKAKIYSGKTSI
jgi:hypothetical protein